MNPLGTLLVFCLMFSASAHAEVPLLVFAGQSNMVGFRTNVNDLNAIEKAEQPHVWFYGPNDDGKIWANIHLDRHPTQSSQTVSGKGFGPEVSVGQALVAAGRDRRVAIVKFVVNGASDCSFIAPPIQAQSGHHTPGIKQSWSPMIRNPANALEAKSLYDGLLNRIHEAQAAFEKQVGEKTYVAAFFWMQGESDAQNEYTASHYGENFHHFATSLRTDLAKPKLPIIFGRIRKSGLFPFDTLVRSQQDSLVDPASPFFLETAACVNTDDCEMYHTVDPSAGDGPGHYSSRGTWQLGESMAKSFQTLMAHKPR